MATWDIFTQKISSVCGVKATHFFCFKVTYTRRTYASSNKRSSNRVNVHHQTFCGFVWKLLFITRCFRWLTICSWRRLQYPIGGFSLTGRGTNNCVCHSSYMKEWGIMCFIGEIKASAIRNIKHWILIEIVKDRLERQNYYSFYVKWSTIEKEKKRKGCRSVFYINFSFLEEHTMTGFQFKIG